MTRVGTFSIGIASILYLEKILDAEIKWLPPGMRSLFRCDAIAGWGMKPSAKEARAFAKYNGLNYIALEDGFLRSIGLGVHGNLEHSFVVDPIGIYYDAHRPSLAENLICSAPDSIECLGRSLNAIDLLKRHRLSKYNAAPEGAVPRHKQGPAVLVVDQTFGDISVELGAGNAELFVQMLDQAISDNPSSEILVKVHPDVIAGKKKGYLLEAARQKKCTLLSTDLNPWSIFDVVSDVYVMTSHLGFEALLAGKRVHCFGLPYYAGWGLTNDRQYCERRTVSRSIEQVFFAVYFQYCRYLNPYTGERCELEDTIELLALQKQHLERNRGEWQVYGALSAQRSAIKKYLGLGATVDFLKQTDAEVLGNNILTADPSVFNNGIVLKNKHKEYQWFQNCALFDLVDYSRYRPVSFSIMEGSREGALEAALNHLHLTESEQAQTIFLSTSIVEYLSSHTVRSVRQSLLNKQVVIVQTQKRNCKKLPKMLSVARQENPNGTILLCIDESPLYSTTGVWLKSNTSNKAFDAELDLLGLTTALQCACKLYTVDSVSAYHALLLDVQVITFGKSTYSGWGLTDDREAIPNRHKQLTLNELIAGVFLKSTYYVDPESGEVVDLQTALTLLSRRSRYPYGLGFWERCKRIIRLVFLRI